MLKSIKEMQKGSGFTIVELLIVIVVIAILAAISVVAYNGIQNRGKASSGQATASMIAKKLESYNAVNSAYPTTKTQIQGTAESSIDGLPNTTTAGTRPIIVPASDSIISTTALTASTANGGESVRINGTATGGFVYWWDYSANPQVERSIKYGP